jgi:hypothetical protein
MHDNQKILLRGAERISSHLHGLKAASIPVELPDGDWTQCQSLIAANRSVHESQVASCGRRPQGPPGAGP